MYKTHSQCRACGYGKPGAPGIKAAAPEKLKTILDLGVQPMANDFRKQGCEHSGYAPLKLLVCPRCGLGQLSVVVNPSVLYRDYPYVTSPSATMGDHFKNLISDIKSESKGRSVVEIGSNDGRLLSVLKSNGYSVFGIDPAQNLADIAKADYGIDTAVGLFGREFTSGMKQFDIVIARHVFCHIHDWHDFLRGLENISHSETLICIEVPHAQDMVEKCEFDTVYHEHLSYMTFSAMEHLLNGTSFHIHRIIKYQIHGGAVLMMLRKNDSVVAPNCDYKESLSMSDWEKFASTVKIRIEDLKSLVHQIKKDGKRIAAIGASAKSTVWVNACEFSRNQIEFIADSTPQKLYTLSPGSDIPIVDEGAVIRELPDYVIVFCWNFIDEVLRKYEFARSKGVKFIIPVPYIEVV